MKKTEAQRKATDKYLEKVEIFNVRLSPENDSDIISHLASITPKSGYIKSLIARDVGAEDKYIDGVIFNYTGGTENQKLMVVFNPETDSEILSKLTYTSKSDYIRGLIRDDINKRSRIPWAEVCPASVLEPCRESAANCIKAFTALASSIEKVSPDKTAECRELISHLAAWLTRTE